MIDEIFSSLEAPLGHVTLAKGATPKEIVEIGINKIDPTLDLRRSASLLASKNILLIGGWIDVNVTIDHHILPLYRAIIDANAKNIKIVALQDYHAFGNSRSELVKTIIGWISSGVTK